MPIRSKTKFAKTGRVDKANKRRSTHDAGLRAHVAVPVKREPSCEKEDEYFDNKQDRLDTSDDEFFKAMWKVYIHEMKEIEKEWEKKRKFLEFMRASVARIEAIAESWKVGKPAPQAVELNQP